ncbi:MAG: C4-dicarboxylate ABC transporter, partial [Sphingomonadales bacterium BRH_c42]
MTAKRIGLGIGALVLSVGALAPAPAGMPDAAWLVAGLVVLMAAWWMTEAVPLTATALMPFVVLPLAGVSTAAKTASSYYAPILFLLLGGAFLALAIERTGMHRRLSLTILRLVGAKGGQARLLLAFMISAALLSMLISNTSTTLIMMPMALAVLAGGGMREGDTDGLSGALPMGIAFAASIGGLGTIVGSPTNGIAVALLDNMIGVRISFAQWMAYGLPVVVLGIPIAALIIAKVQRVADRPFDIAAARAAIDDHAPWSVAEKRLLPVIAITFLLWMTQLLVAPLLPEDSWTDGTIAVIAGLALFVLPDGTGRPLLVWQEADRAPWGVIMMFGGGLALAAGMQASGL